MPLQDPSLQQRCSPQRLLTSRRKLSTWCLECEQHSLQEGIVGGILGQALQRLFAAEVPAVFLGQQISSDAFTSDHLEARDLYGAAVSAMYSPLHGQSGCLEGILVFGQCRDGCP